MLQTMRHLAQSWVFKGLMMILIVSFGIWGIGDIFRGNPMQRTRSPVKAGDEAQSRFRRSDYAFEAETGRSPPVKMGPDVTPQQWRSNTFGLLDKTLDELVARAEIDQAIGRLISVLMLSSTADVWIGWQKPSRTA